LRYASITLNFYKLKNRFSRRKYGWFEAVPADSKYPKKLTYKWGPRAMELLKLRIKTEVQ